MHVTAAPVLQKQQTVLGAGWLSSLADGVVADAWLLWLQPAIVH